VGERVWACDPSPSLPSARQAPRPLSLFNSRIAPNRAPVAEAAPAVSEMGDRHPRAMPAPSCRAQKKPASPPARAAPPVAAAPARAMRRICSAETALAASWGPRPVGMAMGPAERRERGRDGRMRKWRGGWWRARLGAPPALPFSLLSHLPPAPASHAVPRTARQMRRPSWCWTPTRLARAGRGGPVRNVEEGGWSGKVRGGREGAAD